MTCPGVCLRAGVLVGNRSMFRYVRVRSLLFMPVYPGISVTISRSRLMSIHPSGMNPCCHAVNTSLSVSVHMDSWLSASRGIHSVICSR